MPGRGNTPGRHAARVGANAGRSARSANGWGWITKQFQTTWGKIAVLQKFPKTLASSGTSRAWPWAQSTACSKLQSCKIAHRPRRAVERAGRAFRVHTLKYGEITLF
jgi:hypothetical protein